MKVCIAGGGRVGRYLAQSLLANHHEIVIIEPVESQCRMLADMLDIPVICGDSISVDTLRTADVASCDAFVAVTGSDEDNLVACQIAKREFGVDRTVARASNPKNRELLHTLGVDTVVCGTDNLSHILEREIETDTIRQLLSLGGGTASLNEILLPENFLYAGKAIMDIPIPGDTILVSIPLTFCFLGYFNGREHTTFVMAQGLAAAFLVRVPLSYLFSRLPNTGMFLISLAVPISAVANLLLCVGYFLILKRQDARKEKLTR